MATAEPPEPVASKDLVLWGLDIPNLSYYMEPECSFPPSPRKKCPIYLVRAWEEGDVWLCVVGAMEDFWGLDSHSFGFGHSD